jgi:hypothetical protein
MQRNHCDVGGHETKDQKVHTIGPSVAERLTRPDGSPAQPGDRACRRHRLLPAVSPKRTRGHGSGWVEGVRLMMLRCRVVAVCVTTGAFGRAARLNVIFGGGRQIVTGNGGKTVAVARLPKKQKAEVMADTGDAIRTGALHFSAVVCPLCRSLVFIERRAQRLNLFVLAS